jgi:hypothetical protein
MAVPKMGSHRSRRPPRQLASRPPAQQPGDGPARARHRSELVAEKALLEESGRLDTLAAQGASRRAPLLGDLPHGKPLVESQIKKPAVMFGKLGQGPPHRQPVTGREGGVRRARGRGQSPVEVEGGPARPVPGRPAGQVDGCSGNAAQDPSLDCFGVAELIEAAESTSEAFGHGVVDLAVIAPRRRRPPCRLPRPPKQLGGRISVALPGLYGEGGGGKTHQLAVAVGRRRDRHRAELPGRPCRRPVAALPSPCTRRPPAPKRHPQPGARRSEIVSYSERGCRGETMPSGGYRNIDTSRRHP